MAAPIPTVPATASDIEKLVPRAKCVGEKTQEVTQCPDSSDTRKKRCHDRYDSAESSDSGVGVGSFGSSNSSDITEPCSPALSCGSLEEMPPTQNHPTWIWDKEKVNFHHSKPGLDVSPSSDDSLLEPSEPSEPSPPPPPTNTIRFPPPLDLAPSHPHVARHHLTTLSHYLCRWTDCEARLTSSSSLIEHLQVKHVNSQRLGEYYVCLWEDCKVYSRKSCSRTWLERHVLSHGGNKPYRCIVDSCRMRFSSQNLLQRHVNSHFGDSSGQNSSKKSCETSNKLIRRNGKRLRYRRHPFSARAYDYFDAGIMEGVQHSLIEVTERQTLGRLDAPTSHLLTLQSKIMCKKLEPNGQSKILLRWYPPNILEDEWVIASDNVERVRQVNMRSLPSDSKDRVFELLSSNLLSPASRQPRTNAVGRKSTSSNGNS